MSLRHELTLACWEELGRKEWSRPLWLALVAAQAAACWRAEVREFIGRGRR